MKTLFKADVRLHKITIIKVLRETKKYYFTEYESIYKDEYIFETYVEAKHKLLEWSAKQIGFYQYCLENEIKHLKSIIEL